MKACTHIIYSGNCTAFSICTDQSERNAQLESAFQRLDSKHLKYIDVETIGERLANGHAITQSDRMKLSTDNDTIEKALMLTSLISLRKYPDGFIQFEKHLKHNDRYKSICCELDRLSSELRSLKRSGNTSSVDIRLLN